MAAIITHIVIRDGHWLSSIDLKLGDDFYIGPRWLVLVHDVYDHDRRRMSSHIDDDLSEAQSIAIWWLDHGDDLLSPNGL